MTLLLSLILKRFQFQELLWVHVGIPQTSFTLKTNSMVDQTISWSFDGPLATSIETVTVASNESTRWFEAAKRRREVKADKVLIKCFLPEEMLCWSFQRMPLITLMIQTSEHCPILLKVISEMRWLYLIQCYLHIFVKYLKAMRLGIALEKWKYDRLQELLSHLSVDHQSVLQSLNISSPSIPSLPLG